MMADATSATELGAKRAVTASVTDDDIRAGERFSVTETHPVARAVIRALGLPTARPGYWVRVGQDWFGIKGGASFYESHDLDAPPDWITRFDNGEPVEPFTFTFYTAWPGVA
jgi:hypothetical protein